MYCNYSCTDNSCPSQDTISRLLKRIIFHLNKFQTLISNVELQIPIEKIHSIVEIRGWLSRGAFALWRNFVQRAFVHWAFIRGAFVLDPSASPLRG